MLKRNSSVILLLSSLFVLASCGGQPHQTGLSSSESSKSGSVFSPVSYSLSESTASSDITSSESSQATGLSSSDSEPDDPYGNSPMKVTKKHGELIVTSGVQKHPDKATEYQWIKADFTGSTANVEIKFTFTPEGGDPVVYGADKVKTDCAALVEATSDGFFKMKAADKYDFYIETGSNDNGIWVQKHTEIVPTETATWYIAGEGSLWPNADGWSTGMIGMTDTAGDNKAVKLNVTFAVGDKFKVVDPKSSTWLGAGALNAAYAEFEDDGTNNHNISVKTAGTYKITLNSSEKIEIVAANVG